MAPTVCTVREQVVITRCGNGISTGNDRFQRETVTSFAAFIQRIIQAVQAGKTDRRVGFNGVIALEIQTDKDRDFAFGIFGDIINHVKEKAVFRFSGENQPEFPADSGVIQNFSF